MATAGLTCTKTCRTGRAPTPATTRREVQAMTTREVSTANVRPAIFGWYERKNHMFEKSLPTLKLVALLTLGFCALAGSTPARAAAPTPINACGTISAPGNFV